MRAADWRVVPDTTKARKFWEKLDREVRDRIEGELTREPFWDTQNRRSRKHLKGKLDCRREYRDLANNARIYYSVDQEGRVIRLLYGGPHP